MTSTATSSYINPYMAEKHNVIFTGYGEQSKSLLSIISKLDVKDIGLTELKLEDILKIGSKKIKKYSGLILEHNISLVKFDDNDFSMIERLIKCAGNFPILVVLIVSDQNVKIQKRTENQQPNGERPYDYKDYNDYNDYKIYYQSFGQNIQTQIVQMDFTSSCIESSSSAIIFSAVKKFQNLMDEYSSVISLKNIPYNPCDFPEYLLIEQFANCTLPSKLWTHYNRLRIILYGTRKYGIKTIIETDSWLMTNWSNYVKSKSIETEFHKTKIIFWCVYLWELIECNPNESLEIMLEQHPELLCESILYEYYDKKTLDSVKSKEKWCKPTIKQLSIEPVIEDNATSECVIF